MNTLQLILISSIFYLYYFDFANPKRIYYKSSLNNKKYLVRSHNKSSIIQKSANLLAELTKKKSILCDFIESSNKYKSHKGIKRLLENKDVKLEELSYKYNDEAAYSINKGEVIGICLRDKDGKLQNKNTMIYVLIHELAHIMSVNYAHDKEFWNNFAFLLEAAIECNIYKYVDYTHSPTTYCGHDVSQNP